MTTKDLETIVAGLLLEFMNQQGITPLEDGALVVREYGPHIVLEMGGRCGNLRDSEELFSNLVAFLDKHNAQSKMKFSAYNVEMYRDTLYVSIAQ